MPCLLHISHKHMSKEETDTLASANDYNYFINIEGRVGIVNT